MTTWRTFLSWKLRTLFLIRAKSLLWGDPPWWTTEGAKGAYLTAKFLRQDESPWWPPRRVSCPERWGLPSWSQTSLYSEVTHLDDQLKELKELIWQPSFYAKMTHLDDHLKEFLVLEAEDSLPDSQVSTLMWLTLMTKDLKKLILMTAKVLCQDDPPWWPPEGVSCPESWRLPAGRLRKPAWGTAW